MNAPIRAKLDTNAATLGQGMILIMEKIAERKGINDPNDKTNMKFPIYMKYFVWKRCHTFQSSCRHFRRNS